MVVPVSIVAAFCKGFGIGQNGQLPWGRIPRDMQRFRDITMGGAVVMGRKTFESIPTGAFPLRGRLNVVLTSDATAIALKRNDASVIFVGSFEELDAVMEERAHLRWFVIGGTSLFERFLAEGRAAKVFATYIEAVFPSCDAFFPSGELLPSFNLTNAESFATSLQETSEPVRIQFLEYEVRRDLKSDPNGGERGYLELMADILAVGEKRRDRTGTGTLAVFGRQLRFDLRAGRMPMVTTRFSSFRIVAAELLWFLQGKTDAKALNAQGVRIWDGNTSRAFLDSRGLHDLPEGDLGPGYGFQWRHFGAAYTTCADDYSGAGVDQLEAVVALIKTDPHSRRICMTAWNPCAIDRMALPPCHSCFVQFFVDQDNCLSCHMYQRSVDTFLGLATNIPSYALLTHIIAAKCGLTARELIISTGDTHVYVDHVKHVEAQLARSPLPPPRIWVNPDVKDKAWDRISMEDFKLSGYLHHPGIKAQMSA